MKNQNQNKRPTLKPTAAMLFTLLQLLAISLFMDFAKATGLLGIAVFAGLIPIAAFTLGNAGMAFVIMFCVNLVIYTLRK